MEPASVVHYKPNKNSETNATAQLTVLHFMTPNIKEKANIYNENEFPTLYSYLLPNKILHIIMWTEKNIAFVMKISDGKS